MWSTEYGVRSVGAMRDELGVKAGYTIEDVAALMETLRDIVELEEGELYTLRKGTCSTSYGATRKTGCAAFG